MGELIVLTCASGKQCAHIIPRLYGKYPLRLVCNRQESADKLKQVYPQAEVTTAEMTEPSECRRIVSGASTVLHIGPSFHPHEWAIGYNMIDACLSPTTGGETPQHFVYSSVLHTQLRKLMNHDSKRYVEEYLIESKLPWTILSPTKFMEQFPVPLLFQQHQKGEQPVYQALSNPDLPQSSIGLQDLGEAFAKVVEEREKHFYAQYPLCSTLPIAMTKVVSIFEQQLGTKIKVENLPREQADEKLLTAIYGDAKRAPLGSREQASRMLMHYEDRGLQGSPNVLRWLLGREPVQYEKWLKTQVGKVQGK